MTRLRHRSLVLVGFIGSMAVGCGAEAGRQSPGSGIEDPGPVHVHGLGINPKDRALFLATHTGLYRAAEGQKEATRVADRYQDTMGFTVIGPDRFLGSGHPDGRENLPPFLGLIESTDAGRSWRPVSLLGKADFHVLEAAGETVYGFGSDFETGKERLLVSQNRGKDWDERSTPKPLTSLAIDLEDPQTVVASSERGLLRSDDEGRDWQDLSGDPGLLGWPAKRSSSVPRRRVGSV